MAGYASGSDDDSPAPVSQRRPRGLFSDEEDSDDDRDRGRFSEAEEDNSLNRREGGVGASTQDKNTDDEEEEDRKRQEKKKKDEEKKKKPKGPVRRQMLSEEMLTGKNGLSVLPELFKDFTFGGKGRERKDLDKILSKLEHWIHLLHPKQPFDQSLQRIEFLGGKRKVIKTHLKRIRMGMLNSYEFNDEVVEEDEDMMNNIDATELAESASAFVNEEMANLGDEMSSAPTKQGNSGSNENEFPDDDDDFFETIEETATAKSKALDDMDIDMEDIPQVNDDDEDDFFQKQIEAQMKRAEAESQQRLSPSVNSGASTSNTKEQVLDSVINTPELDEAQESVLEVTDTLLASSSNVHEPSILTEIVPHPVADEPNQSTECAGSTNNELDENVNENTISPASGDVVEEKADNDDDGINMDDLEEDDD